jgi:predicted transcriptional regulator
MKSPAPLPPVGSAEKGLSQLALAKRARVAQAYISEMEAGPKKNPR